MSSKRPFGISLIAGFTIFQGATNALVGLILAVLAVGYREDFAGLPWGALVVIGLLSALIGSGIGAVGLGLWRLKRGALMCMIPWSAFQCVAGVIVCLGGDMFLGAGYDASGAWAGPLIFHGGMFLYMVLNRNVRSAFR